MKNIRGVFVGDNTSYVIRQDNTLWATGWNWAGQIGNGTTTERRTFVKIMADVRTMSAGYIHALVIKNDNSLWGIGRSGFEASDSRVSQKEMSGVSVKIMDSVQAVSAGDAFSFIVKMDNTVWSAGYNYNGQLGDGTRVSRRDFVKVTLL